MNAEQKKGPAPDRRFPWGRIVDVHVVGTYALIEYMSSKPGNAEPGWKSERRFSGYLHKPESTRADARGWMDIGQSFPSMEAGLAGVIAYAFDGCNSQAARYFMKMIAPDVPMPAVAPARVVRGGYETRVSLREIDKALAELTAQGQGTTLDLPAAILHALRRAVVDAGGAQ